ncbi:MAG: hypothetical protein JO128_08640 [Alphaproteobacteria bacterium]|nr:hypothetical protein [Alphaproteobacteria bacterium]
MASGCQEGRALLSLLPLVLWLVAAPALPVRAEDYTLNGFADARLVQPSNQRSWAEGGLGKLRFNGGSDSGIEPHLAEIAADGKAQVTPELAFFGTVHVAPNQYTPVDILEGYARYRPVDNSSFQWTTKAGAFFPPISLENESVAWTSPWTLTPSAINTWVGEELRTIGGETTGEWRFGGGALQATGALFGWNSVGGTLLEDRGWSLGDSYTGVFGKVRLPDVVARRQADNAPYYEEPFVQIGSSPGWYAGGSGRLDGFGKISFLHYDNRADPTIVRNDQIGWRTKFDSLGVEVDIDEFVLLSQAMSGSTEIDPTPTFRSITDFHSAYLLAGRYFGNVTVAARVEFFDTHNQAPSFAANLSEHGHAGTVAVSWRPVHWLRFTAEALRVDSYRHDRINAGLAPRAVENQFQLSARAFF